MSLVKLGIDMLDAEHDALSSLNLDLFNAVNGRGPEVDTFDLVARLYSLAQSHFRSEEALFEGWQGSQHHTRLHSDIVQRLNILFAKFDSLSPDYTAENQKEHLVELSKFVDSWLNHHVAFEDTKYIEYVLEKQKQQVGSS